MRLAVLADTTHHCDGEGQLYAKRAVAAQLDIWAALFEEVELCAPLWAGPPPPEFAPYAADNITLRPLPLGGGPSWWAKARLAPLSLCWWRAIRQVLSRVEAVHIRCPCNIGGIALIATRRAGIHRYAMYAGNWYGYPGEPWSYRLQRWLLRRWFHGVVTVYADPGDLPEPHLVPFFSPSVTGRQWEREAEATTAKVAAMEAAGWALTPIRLVSVGTLTENKNHGVVLQAVARLRGAGMNVELDIAGDGPLLDDLRQACRDLQLDGAVRLHGNCDGDTLWGLYRAAHLNILISKTEGYPKVVLEGMVAGVVPVVSDFPVARSLVGSGERGVVVDGRGAAALAACIDRVVADPAGLATMARACREFSRSRTLEAFEDALRKLLRERWGLPAGQASAIAEPNQTLP
jgi:glycosyltransferase involved in cell wall biosynthesis